MHRTRYTMASDRPDLAGLNHFVSLGTLYRVDQDSLPSMAVANVKSAVVAPVGFIKWNLVPAGDALYFVLAHI